MDSESPHGHSSIRNLPPIPASNLEETNSKKDTNK